MSKKVLKTPNYRRIELDGVHYVILRKSVFEELCRRAEVVLEATVEPGAEADALDGATLAEKLVRRRRASGLSQAELARRAGVRPETLNRIERGRTTPDFATVRKLVLAMNAAEQAAAQTSLSGTPRKDESAKRPHKQE